MNGTTIPRVKSHVHLGITTTSDLRWSDHVAAVLKKVAPALNLTLTLAYHNQLPPEVIRKSNVAFIRPRMEYCNAVWCSASAGSLKLLEKVQLKVAWAIAHAQGGQPGSEVLSKCNLPTLAWRKTVHCLCVLYKLYNGHAPWTVANRAFPATVQARTETVLRSSDSFCFPSATSSQHLSSFLCFSVGLWNNLLASDISQSHSVSSVRSLLPPTLSTKQLSFLFVSNFQS